MNHIVCDTNCLSGYLWNGAPHRVVERVLAGRDKLFISKTLVAELNGVLHRPKFKALLNVAELTPRQILRDVVDIAVLVEPKPLGETVIPNDPSDEAVLACAVTAGADVVVSGDKKHLLPLGSYRGIRILSASQYLAEVENEEMK
ncbi:MAG: putative toxin-antitoxin system toxin component, PIN family [Kiritimatiellales bacterium]|nr:putative toxin-antitoxin system toxin component, PIN family [Kiritimatiellales bacterium]